MTVQERRARAEQEALDANRLAKANRTVLRVIPAKYPPVLALVMGALLTCRATS